MASIRSSKNSSRSLVAYYPEAMLMRTNIVRLMRLPQRHAAGGDRKRAGVQVMTHHGFPVIGRILTEYVISPSLPSSSALQFSSEPGRRADNPATPPK